MSKEKPNLKKTTESEHAVLSLEEYLSQVKVNPGLVASFRYEASQQVNGLQPRTTEEWQRTIEEQSNRMY